MVTHQVTHQDAAHRGAGRQPILALAVAALVALGGLPAQGAEQPSFKELLERLLPDMGHENVAQRRDGQQRFQDACFRLGAPGRQTERAEACKLIAEKLAAQTPKPARIWLLKQLEQIGGGECVQALAQLLDDPDAEIRESARRALEANPAPEATAKLLAGLQSAQEPQWRVALANSLGARGDPASVPTLARLLGQQDQAVVAAAARALGKIGGPEAAEALMAAAWKVPAPVFPEVADAAMCCADKFLAQGQRDQAAALYRRFYQPDMPRAVRLAALQGLLQASGEQAAPRVAELLAGQDADGRAIAAGHIENLLGRGVMKTSASELSRLPPAGQVLLLAGLAAQGDKQAMPVALAAARSGNQDVRLAGLRALGRLGDASVVPLLIEALASNGPARQTAAQALQQVFGTGVDEAIVEAMQRAETPLRGLLIEVLAGRKAPLAVPALIRQLDHPEVSVRGPAWNALGNLAEPKELAALVPLLLKTAKGPEREVGERAIALIARRIEPPEDRAKTVLDALRKAPHQDRLVLLSLAGRIGGPEAMKAIREAMHSDDRELHEAGVRALCNWPDASVADELLKMAHSSDDPTYRIWALRAYVRVVGLPSDRPPGETLAMFKKAMQLARRDQERRLILARAAEARDVETLRWLVPYLDNPALADDAGRTVVDLARRRELFTRSREEFVAALRKVAQVCKDGKLVERAKRLLQEH
ncbi:MAG: HEAT repeat domain-containing protein [Thermoguttaceae bacterium]